MDATLTAALDASISDELVVHTYRAVQRSLRIAYVTETYPPEVNGVAMSTARMVEGLQQRNHDVQLIRPRQDAPCPTAADAERSPRLHEVLTRGLPIPRYPHLRMGVASKRSLVKLWSVQRPDVVHLATEGPLCWAALQAAHVLKLPVCSDFRTNFHAYSRHYGIGWLRRPIMAYLRKFHNRTLCTMVPTEALRRELAGCGFARVTVVSRGVDTLQFSPHHRSEGLRAAWGAAPGDPVLLCVGRLAAEKNLGTLLAAFDATLRRCPRARLVLVGDGPLRAELQARCPQAVFAGQRTGHDLAAHYASADVFVFPSLTETFGNVTTEALASGLPVVAFDYAAAAQVVRPGENGLLAPFGDADHFLQGTAALAGDARRCRAMGWQARATAEALGWDGVVARFEQVLTGLIDQPGDALIGHASGHISHASGHSGTPPRLPVARPLA